MWSCVVRVCLCNLSSREVKIPPHTKVGQVQTANRMSDELVPKVKGESEEHSEEPDYSDRHVML